MKFAIKLDFLFKFNLNILLIWAQDSLIKKRTSQKLQFKQFQAIWKNRVHKIYECTKYNDHKIELYGLELFPELEWLKYSLCSLLGNFRERSLGKWAQNQKLSILKVVL